MSNKIKHSKLAKARAGLIIDQPFFASILLSMPIEIDNSVPTMATDGESIKYNEQWTEKLSLPETVFVLAHETLHCVFDHMGRRGHRSPNRWNQAADYIINDLLVKEKIGSMPHGGLLNPNLVTQGGSTAEGVYTLLPESDENKGAGQPGGALDSVYDAGSNNGQNKADQATIAEKSAALKVRVIAAKNAAKMAGKLSANLERLVNDIVKPRYDWREILRRFITERAKNEYSFAKPKRRFLSQDLYLPSLSGQKMGEIVVAVDCSGSINDSLLAAFSAEINAIKQDTCPSKITVLYFDHDLCGEPEIFGPDDDLALSPRGGGGTAFSPIFNFVNNLDEAPACVVVLTDLYCNDYGNAPDCPVLWTCLENTPEQYQKVPFGEVITVNSESEE